MNKGLELIEAHHLFGTPYDRIDVVVHPQSIVHSLIALCDGATLAHLGYPDMRVPISYALHYPDREDVPVPPLDLVSIGSLTFEPADEETFSCLRLAREAARAGGTRSVHAERGQRGRGARVPDRKAQFLEIEAVIEETLDQLPAERSTRSRRSARPTRGPRLAGELVARALACRKRPLRTHNRACHTRRVSYLLAFLGFVALIVLHEAGHFTAAKAVGMRVERFSLFFGPMLVKFSAMARPSMGSARSRSGAT